MELVLPMYNVHPSLFFPQKFGQKNAHYTWQNMVLFVESKSCFLKRTCNDNRNFT